MCGLGNPLVFKNEKKVVTFPFTLSGPGAPAGMHCILKREAETGCSCSPWDPCASYIMAISLSHRHTHPHVAL